MGRPQRSLEAQAKSSIATGSMSMRETDTPVKIEVIEERFRSAPEYVSVFRAALPGAPINLDSMARAIAAFQRTLEPGIAPFDRWIDGDEDAIPQSAKRGFVLFNRDANCFACHGGWRLTDDKFHDIGTTTTRSRPRPRTEERRGYAVRVQDADPARRRVASSVHAQRVVDRPVRGGAALRKRRHLTARAARRS